MNTGSHTQQRLLMTEPMTETVVREHINSQRFAWASCSSAAQSVDLKEKMKHDLYKVDAQRNTMGLDSKMIDSYLKVQNQAISLYKSEPTRMPYYKIHTQQHQQQHQSTELASGNRCFSSWTRPK